LAIIALLLISSACLGTIAIFAETLSSQSPTSNNTTSIEKLQQQEEQPEAIM
jgi:hypothetical protein